AWRARNVGANPSGDSSRTRWWATTSMGCRATPTRSRAAGPEGISREARAESTSRPTWTIRSTPTPWAAVRYSVTSTPPAAGSCPSRNGIDSRWVWLSTTRVGSGSGAAASVGTFAISLTFALGAQALEFRLDDTLIEFREHRGRFPHGGSRREVPARPRALHRRVIAGDDRVLEGGIVEVGHLIDPRLRRDEAAAAEGLVHRLRGMWQERGEHRIDVADRLGSGEQHGSLTVPVFLELPRRGIGQVLVRLRHQVHRFVDRRALAVGSQQLAHLLEPGVDLREQRSVRVGEVGGGDLAEVLVDEVRGAVDEVAPAGDELVVRAAVELRPGEVRVVGFRAGDSDEVPQRVGLVAGEHVPHVDDHASGGGELFALGGEEFARDDLGRQFEGAERAGLSAVGAAAVVGEELSGPDLGMEGDVVLAHEVIGLGRRVGPPRLPLVCRAEPARPFH